MSRQMVLRLQGAFELAAVVLFFTGYFGGVPWLMILGGLLLVADNLMTIGLGLANPLLPLGLATLLALVMRPWYVGVFFGCSAFTLLGLPNSARKLWDPKRVLADAERVDAKRQSERAS